MHAPNDTELKRIFHQMRMRGDITVINGVIMEAAMNLSGRPQLARFVKPLMSHLYTQTQQVGLRFDAVAGVPNGGVAWAESLVDIVSDACGCRVPLLDVRKQKATDGFKVARRQPVSPPARVLVVDDTIGKGTNSVLATGALKQKGYEIAGLMFVVALEEYGLDLWNKSGPSVFTAFDTAFATTLHRNEVLA